MPPKARHPVGSVWTATQDGKVWPVVIFPIGGMTDKFMSTRTSSTSIPVFYMGRHTLRWLEPRDLDAKKFDVKRDYSNWYKKLPGDETSPALREQHQNAFKEAKENHKLEYFQDLVKTKEKSHKANRTLDTAKQTVSTPKRDEKTTSLKKAPSGTTFKAPFQTLKRKTTQPEVIDLCGDDEEDDEPAFKKPRTTTKDPPQRSSNTKGSSKAQSRMVEEVSDSASEEEDEEGGESSPDPFNPLSFKKKPPPPTHEPKKTLPLTTPDPTLSKASSTESTAKQQSIKPLARQATQDPRKRLTGSLSGPGAKVDSGANGDVRAHAKAKEPSTQDARKLRPTVGLPTPPATLIRSKFVVPPIDSDEEIAPSPITPTPVSKTSRLGKFDTEESAPLDTLLRNKVLKPIEEEPEVEKPPEVIIYIGNGENEEGFHFDKKELTRHSHFKRLLDEAQSTSTDDSVPVIIRTSDLEAMSPIDFRPVAEYIHTRDYKPNLVDGKSPHLKHVQSMFQHEQVVKLSSTLWNTAKSYNLEDLQQLIMRKMMVISPLEDYQFLILTRFVFFYVDEAETDVDKAMRTWLKDEVADRYYPLMKSNGPLLIKAMKTSFELAGYVHQKLADDPERGFLDLSREDEE